MPSNYNHQSEYPADWGRRIVPTVLRRDHDTCKLNWSNCTILAREVDHIIPISVWKYEKRAGSVHDFSNLQAVCHACHNEKTRQEIDDARTIRVSRPGPQSAGWLDPIEQSLLKTDKKYATGRETWIKTMGPMWEVDGFGAYRLPKYTLGWQVLAWVSRFLQIKGEPFIPTGEQARFLLWAYAVDQYGNWLYDENMKMAPKGWGKDPMLAMIASIEFIGPCRFGGWAKKADGTKVPIAVTQPGAKFQIAAGSDNQAAITFIYLKDIFTEEAISRYQIKIPRGPKIFANNRSCTIERLTSTPTSKEGDPPSGAGMSELEHWTERNGLYNLYKVLKRNVDKVPTARTWIITNAYQPQHASMAQALVEEHEAYLAGRVVNPRRMIDAKMATEHAPYQKWEDRIWVIAQVYGESIAFVDPVRIARNFDSLTIPISEVLAFFYNCITSSATTWVDIRKWDAVKEWDLPADGLPPKGTKIILAGDMSKNQDATALVGIVFGGKYDKLIFPLGIWLPSKKQEMDRAAVDKRVQWAFDYYKPQAFWVDPSHRTDESDVLYWGPMVEEWGQRYGQRIHRKMWASKDNAVKFDMTSGENNKTFVDALETMEGMISDKLVRQNGDEVLRSHVQNARLTTKKGGNQRWTIGKESDQSPLKIDGIVTAVIALAAYLVLYAWAPPTPYKEPQKTQG